MPLILGDGRDRRGRLRGLLVDSADQLAVGTGDVGPGPEVEHGASASATSGFNWPGSVPARAGPPSGERRRRPSAAKSASASAIRSCQGPKTGSSGSDSLLEEPPPPRDDLRAQVLGGQREEEDRRLERVRRRRRGPDQVVGRPLPRRFGEELVLAVEELPELAPLRRGLLLELARLAVRVRPVDQRQLERGLAAGEDAVERIIVGRGDGVVLVVVAAGTGDGQAQEAAGDRVDPVVDLVVDVVVEHPCPASESPSRPAARADPWARPTSAASCSWTNRSKRQVLVEGADDVIAVGVGVRAERGRRRTSARRPWCRRSGRRRASAGPSARRNAARPAGDRRPARRRPGTGRFSKASISSGGRRQADQVVVDPAEQRAAIGGRRRRQARGFQPRQHERVDRRVRPARVASPRGSRGLRIG